MPLVTATLALLPSPEVTGSTIKALTDLTVNVLGKERERTTVVVRYVPPAQWARGGIQSDLSGARRYVVEVMITAGTNSPNEKARYVGEVQRAFVAILGEGAAGYVAVHEIAADSWGHAGETQEARYARAALAKTAETFA